MLDRNWYKGFETELQVKVWYYKIGIVIWIEL